MDYEKFAETLKEAAPSHKADAVPLWRDFAAECVENEQFVHFEVIADKNAAVEKWLDVLSAGICAVSKSFGNETAAAVVNLSCEHCCLYPGEMMQAAICLENGGDGRQIFAMIESGEIDCLNLFAPMSRQEAEKQIPRIGSERPQSVLAKLTAMPPQNSRKAKTMKKNMERE